MASQTKERHQRLKTCIHGPPRRLIHLFNGPGAVVQELCVCIWSDVIVDLGACGQVWTCRVRRRFDADALCAIRLRYVSSIMQRRQGSVGIGIPSGRLLKLGSGRVGGSIEQTAVAEGLDYLLVQHFLAIAML